MACGGARLVAGLLACKMPPPPNYCQHCRFSWWKSPFKYPPPPCRIFPYPFSPSSLSKKNPLTGGYQIGPAPFVWLNLARASDFYLPSPLFSIWSVDPVAASLVQIYFQRSSVESSRGQSMSDTLKCRFTARKWKLKTRKSSAEKCRQNAKKETTNSKSGFFNCTYKIATLWGPQRS